MNRTEELRQQVIEQLQTDIADFEKHGGDEFGSDSVAVDIVTARRTVELLKKLEAPVEAKWLTTPMTKVKPAGGVRTAVRSSDREATKRSGAAPVGRT